MENYNLIIWWRNETIILILPTIFLVVYSPRLPKPCNSYPHSHSAIQICWKTWKTRDYWESEVLHDIPLQFFKSSVGQYNCQPWYMDWDCQECRWFWGWKVEAVVNLGKNLHKKYTKSIFLRTWHRFFNEVVDGQDLSALSLYRGPSTVLPLRP